MTALRLTNLPDKDWGPRREANRIGRYAHLSQKRQDQTPAMPSRVQALIPIPIGEKMDAVQNPTFEPNAF